MPVLKKEYFQGFTDLFKKKKSTERRGNEEAKQIYRKPVING